VVLVGLVVESKALARKPPDGRSPPSNA